MERSHRRMAWPLWMVLIVCIAFACGCTLEQPEVGVSPDEAVSVEVDAGSQDAQPSEATTPVEKDAADVSATGVETEAEDATDSGGDDVQTGAARGAWEPREGYTLTKVVGVSRHNLRAPLADDVETLGAATTHEWLAFDVDGGELTNKGGIAETLMGQFFRRWLEDEGLQKKNWMPLGGEVRIYANAYQRTIATAQSFVSGMLPVANAEIEWHGEFGDRDPVYRARSHIDTDSYKAAATSELTEPFGDAGMAGFDEGLQDSYDLIMDVCDYKNSKGYKSGEFKDLVVGDSTYQIVVGKEPQPVGSIATAAKLSDALVLQYLATTDDTSASFGRELTEEQWNLISEPKVIYYDRVYDADLISCDCANALVDEVAQEIRKPGRVFTMLVCHDRNMASLLHALDVSDYRLPDTLEYRIPIGSKILFELWEGDDGGQYVNIRIVYATTEQLRNLEPLTLQTPPASFDLEFEGLERNADGLYELKDVLNLFDEKLEYYPEILETYGTDTGEAELDAAA